MDSLLRQRSTSWILRVRMKGLMAVTSVHQCFMALHKKASLLVVLMMFITMSKIAQSLLITT